ncbi:hypothetical protein LWI29_036647 [Acer saccharum]|uniref:Uncharacterized protein n=1 Tax=Acer saccharum TaxID=4024 RepID=A0AA39RNV9_ACESA|nr:hypothetical protein LWI29_036647 [Acer saccharum]
MVHSTRPKSAFPLSDAQSMSGLEALDDLFFTAPQHGYHGTRAVLPSSLLARALCGFSWRQKAKVLQGKDVVAVCSSINSGAEDEEDCCCEETKDSVGVISGAALSADEGPAAALMWAGSIGGAATADGESDVMSAGGRYRLVEMRRSQCMVAILVKAQ